MPRWTGQWAIWPRYTRYRAAKESLKAAYYNTQSSRGLVVLNVGNQYLQTLADQSQIDSSEALLRADEVLLKQAQAEHEAGTAARLDELRARVQYQTQQQKVIAAQNTFEKDKILLKREIGVPVEQAIQLTDTAPYADLEQMSIEDARHMAYQSRQDYQGMQRQVNSARSFTLRGALRAPAHPDRERQLWRYRADAWPVSRHVCRDGRTETAYLQRGTVPR